MPPHSKTKKTLPPKNRQRKLIPQRPPHRTARPKLHGRTPQMGTRTLWLGRKRKSPNNKTPPNPKQTKKTSNSKVPPLTTADIPDIVAAFADANQREKPAQVRTSRRTMRSGNRASQDDSPSGDSQPSSDEESVEHEDFGKCNCTTRCTPY